MPAASVAGLLHELPIPKLRQLGGKFGEELQQQLGIKTVGEVMFAAQKALLCFLHSERNSELGLTAGQQCNGPGPSCDILSCRLLMAEGYRPPELLGLGCRRAGSGPQIQAGGSVR